jgi:hypothetical protein
VQELQLVTEVSEEINSSYKRRNGRECEQKRKEKSVSLKEIRTKEERGKCNRKVP